MHHSSLYLFFLSVTINRTWKENAVWNSGLFIDNLLFCGKKIIWNTELFIYNWSVLVKKTTVGKKEKKNQQNPIYTSLFWSKIKVIIFIGKLLQWKKLSDFTCYCLPTYLLQILAGSTAHRDNSITCVLYFPVDITDSSHWRYLCQCRTVISADNLKIKQLGEQWQPFHYYISQKKAITVFCNGCM